MGVKNDLKKLRKEQCLKQADLAIAVGMYVSPTLPPLRDDRTDADRRGSAAIHRKIPLIRRTPCHQARIRGRRIRSRSQDL